MTEMMKSSRLTMSKQRDARPELGGDDSTVNGSDERKEDGTSVERLQTQLGEEKAGGKLPGSSGSGPPPTFRTLSDAPSRSARTTAAWPVRRSS